MSWVCREWTLVADPDGADPAERDKDAHVSETFGGGARVDANLDPVGGAIVKNAFDRIVDEFFMADAIAEGLARLWNDVPLSPDQLADILGQDPDIQRFVYGAQEQPIRYNPKHRLFTGRLREAILTRDRRFPGDPPDRGEGDDPP